MANLRDKKKKYPIDPVERRRILKEEIIQRNADRREAEQAEKKKKKKKPTTPSRKPMSQAQPGRMSAIKKGGTSPLDFARQTRKGPAKY